MPYKKGENPNHPQKYASIKVAPIRSKKAIKNIKKILSDHPRNYCLFTLGINTAYRANELLSIRVGQVKYLKVGELLDLKQSKTNKYRMVTLNQTAVDAIRQLLRSRKYDDDDYLFWSQRREVLTVPTTTNLVKEWCQNVGLKGNYGSHTLRKTWGYWQYQRGTALPLLMEAFGHVTQQQTLAYLCIQPKELREIFQMEL